MKNVFILIFTLVASFAIGQDSFMFETHTLTPKDGRAEELDQAIKNHNKLYHADGPYFNYVHSIINGPRTGDLLFAMGPVKFADLDNRPGSMEHNKDWNKVLSFSNGGGKNLEFWEMSEDLSFEPEGVSYDQMKLSNARVFNIKNYEGFYEMQKKFKAVKIAMGAKRPQIMYRNRAQNKEGRDFMLLSWYGSWADVDAWEGPTFQEAYTKMYGAEEWKKMVDTYDDIIVSREDEMRYVRKDLQAPPKK